MTTLDKILLSCAVFMVIFITVMIVLFCIFQQTPDVLIESVFTLAGSEAVITFVIWWIKKKASLKGDKK